MTFSQYLEKLRDGRSKAHAARRCKVSRMAWQEWESGQMPGVSSLPKIAEGFGVPLAEVRQAWIEGGAE